MAHLRSRSSACTFLRHQELRVSSSSSKMTAMGGKQMCHLKKKEQTSFFYIFIYYFICESAAGMDGAFIDHICRPALYYSSSYMITKALTLQRSSMIKRAGKGEERQQHTCTHADAMHLYRHSVQNVCLPRFFPPNN